MMDDVPYFKQHLQSVINYSGCIRNYSELHPCYIPQNFSLIHFAVLYFTHGSDFEKQSEQLRPDSLPLLAYQKRLR